MSITSGLLPAGVVFPYSGSTAPKGWLLCDGSDISITLYADLYAAIGTTYNTQINPTTGSAWGAPTGFRVPDYRGTFLRGTGTPSGQSAVTLGGHQGDAMQGHIHNLYGSHAGANAPSGYYLPSSNANYWGVTDNLNAAVGPNPSGVGSPAADPTNGSPRTTTETRPINKGVNYIVKY